MTPVRIILVAVARFADDILVQVVIGYWLSIQVTAYTSLIILVMALCLQI